MRQTLGPEELRAYERLFTKYHGASVVDDSRDFLENYRNITRLIGRTSPPNGQEVLVHDLSNPTRSICCIEGGKVTGRSLEMGMTALPVDLMRRVSRNEDKLNYELNVGQSFKCTTIPILRKDYGAPGAVCISIDVNDIRDEVLASAEQTAACFRTTARRTGNSTRTSSARTNTASPWLANGIYSTWAGAAPEHPADRRRRLRTTVETRRPSRTEKFNVHGATFGPLTRSDSGHRNPTRRGAPMVTTSRRQGARPATGAGSYPGVPTAARDPAPLGPRRAALRALPLVLATVLVGLGLSVAPAAHAGLGEPVESVQRDHAALRGTALAVTPTAAFDRHEITTAEGTRVREYASRTGTVFAVTWYGRSLPDLKVVLGQHYDAYAAATTGHRGNHHVFTIETADLVLYIRKLPRGITGSAHVPALLPPGMATQDIR